MYKLRGSCELTLNYASGRVWAVESAEQITEVARLCGCSPAAARKRLSRSRKLLAKELEVEA